MLIQNENLTNGDEDGIAVIADENLRAGGAEPTKETSPESQAYDKLYEFIRLDLLQNPRLAKMVDLREKLMIYLRSMGATEIPESTKKHFRRKLEKEFGDLLQFEDLLNNNKLFVLLKNLSKVQVAREVVTVSQQLDNRDTPSKVKEIQQIGLHIRDAVLSSNTEMSWPPKPYVFIMGYVTSLWGLCDTLSQCFISGASVYILRCLHLYSFESYDRLFTL